MLTEKSIKKIMNVHSVTGGLIVREYAKIRTALPTRKHLRIMPKRQQTALKKRSVHFVNRSFRWRSMEQVHIGRYGFVVGMI